MDDLTDERPSPVALVLFGHDGPVYFGLLYGEPAVAEWVLRCELRGHDYAAVPTAGDWPAGGVRRPWHCFGTLPPNAGDKPRSPAAAGLLFHAMADPRCGDLAGVRVSERWAKIASGYGPAAA